MEKWGGPLSFLSEGILVKRPVDIANLQITYFVDKIKGLVDNLPRTNTNPLGWLQKAMERWDERGKFPKFKFKEISHLKTSQLISNLNNSTAFGIDYIDALALKAAATHLIAPIQHLVNTSLLSSTYPNRWKLSKLLPLLKSSDANKLLPGSYTPITILPAISKITEKAAQEQLLEYLEQNRMINDNTHGYRKGHSTTTALIDITNKLYRAIDEKKIAAIMTLDQSAAFDSVHHEIILSKLELYHLDRSAVEWIRNYLSFRSQFVSIGTAQSRMCTMDRGVPQGSVLGPLLYTIYNK